MRISYNKLWKMLIDKNMKKSDLKEKAGISSASLAKLGKGDNITTDGVNLENWWIAQWAKLHQELNPFGGRMIFIGFQSLI